MPLSTRDPSFAKNNRQISLRYPNRISGSGHGRDLQATTSAIDTSNKHFDVTINLTSTVNNNPVARRRLLSQGCNDNHLFRKVDFRHWRYPLARWNWSEEPFPELTEFVAIPDNRTKPVFRGKTVDPGKRRRSGSTKAKRHRDGRHFWTR